MIEKLARNLQILYLTQIYAWKTQLEYRAQALIWFVYFSGQALLTFVFVNVVYSVSSGIPGWSYAQMLLLSSSAIMMIGIVNYFVDIFNIGQSLLSGDFDAQLARPISPIMILLSNFNGTTMIASVITGLFLFLYAASLLGITLAQIALFFVLFALGTLISTLFILVLVVSSYKLFRGGGWVNWFTNTLSSAVKYPLNIYGILGTLLFTFIVPLGFATYYPVEAITGKLDAYAIVVVVIIMIAVIAVLFRIFNYLFKSYSSGMG
ncbi:MAG: ABC-2 family transporter protein [Candidatus Micrarchaeota archaeon]|nr:ABC-2 family transporter protein [Candidatus Micrarchaeota archaeon]